ncbi:MBL fold metallo-hydrolase [candidate division KSB1 bacterium]|nr:MAG: MBL fold metallo-hydrolase [candidate division KSB1 bacterium]
MIIEQIHTAGDRNFGYLVADPDSKAAAVIDPSGAPDTLASRVDALGLVLKWIICTHHHYDHTGGADVLRSRYGVPLALHRSSPAMQDISLEDGQELELGSIRPRIIHTPGHTEDSICIYVQGAVFTGDTLFVGKVGGTDFAEGARAEYHSLQNKLMVLPEETVVYPGHDVGVRPVSTIRDEKKQNPFLQQPDFEHFVSLKRNWQRYKAEHGIK